MEQSRLTKSPTVYFNFLWEIQTSISLSTVLYASIKLIKW